MILDHPVALLTLRVASVDAITARKSAGGGAESVVLSDAMSVMRMHRAGGAVLRF